MVTTRAHLQEGQQWLDNNLLPMFTNYISKHLAFIPNIDHPVTQQADHHPQTTTMTTYVNALKSEINLSATATTTQQAKRFNKLPKPYRTRQLDYNFDPNDFPDTITNQKLVTTSQNTESNSNTQSQTTTMTTANGSNTRSTNKPVTTVDIAAIQQTIMQNLKTEIDQHIQQQVQAEMATLRTDLRGFQQDSNQKHDSVQAQLTSILNFMSSLTKGGGMR